MSDAPAEQVPDTLSERVRRGFAMASGVMNSLGTVIIVVGMVIVCGDVAARNLFNAPFFGVPELLKMTIIAIVFLQLPHAVITGRMIRSDVLLESLPTRAGHALNAVHMICGALFLAAIAWGVWPQLVEAVKYNHFVGLWIGFQAPVWPIRTIIVAGAIFGCAAYLLNAVIGERRM